MLGLFASLLIALGCVGLVRITQNVLGLAIVATIAKIFVAFLFQPETAINILLFSTIVVFIVRLVVFWVLVRYEDSFLVKILAVIVLTLF